MNKVLLMIIFVVSLSNSVDAQEIVYRQVRICNAQNIETAKRMVKEKVLIREEYCECDCEKCSCKKQKSSEISKNVVSKPQITRYKSTNREFDNGQYFQSRTRVYQNSMPFSGFSRMGCSTSG